jgi:hypothetical protein
VVLLVLLESIRMMVDEHTLETMVPMVRQVEMVPPARMDKMHGNQAKVVDMEAMVVVGVTESLVQMAKMPPVSAEMVGMVGMVLLVGMGHMVRMEVMVIQVVMPPMDNLGSLVQTVPTYSF